MTNAEISGALLAAPSKPKPPTSKLIETVARADGVSPMRQFREMLRLCVGRRPLSFHEYYSNRVYRPDLSPAEKSGFVGEKGSARLNRRLSPLSVTGLRPFVRDKALYGSVMAHLGFSVPRIQAVFSTVRSYGRMKTLRTAADIETFLTEDAVYPVFVKPEEGSGSIGSALIESLDRERGALLLSNGNLINLEAFAAQVEAEYSAGFLFQDAVKQHRVLSDVAGRAVGSIRVVTVQDDEGVSCLYALWKVPSPSAMSDNYWQPGSMLAELDSGTGRILQCLRGTGPDQERLENHPVSGAVFTDITIPHWPEVLEVTRDAHSMLPTFGVIGWDIAITEDGPMIIESNANPHHMLYQIATGKGILNDAFAPVFDRIAARGQRLRKKRKQSAKDNLRDK